LALLPKDAVGISIITVHESLRGRLAAAASARDGPGRIRRYAQLLGSVHLFCQLPVVPFDQKCEDQFQHLLARRLRVGSQDLKIAATALANRLTLLTRNRGDFARIAGLGLDDWSV
jgi:tRNA(fMet)-specific endonuclease VapC